MAGTWRKARPVADAGDRAASLFITSVAGTTFSGRPPEAGKLKQSSEVESASVALAVIPLAHSGAVASKVCRVHSDCSAFLRGLCTLQSEDTTSFIPSRAPASGQGGRGWG